MIRSTARRALSSGVAAVVGGGGGGGVGASFGQSYLGCLGHPPSLGDVARPVAVPSLSHLHVIGADSGWGHSCFLCNDGTLRVWGRPTDFRNTLRHIGLKGSAPILQSFIALMSRFLFPADTEIAGAVHTPKIGDTWIYVCASPGGGVALLTDKGDLDIMGANQVGQAGLGPGAPIALHMPTRVSGAAWGGGGGEHLVSVSLGLEHTLAVTNKGGLYSWGRGDRGALGGGTKDTFRSPVRVTGRDGALLDVHFISVEAGVAASYAIDKSGQLWVWGKMLGLEPGGAAIGGTKEGEHVMCDQMEPRIVEFPRDNSNNNNNNSSNNNSNSISTSTSSSGGINGGGVSDDDVTGSENDTITVKGEGNGEGKDTIRIARADTPNISIQISPLAANNNFDANNHDIISKTKGKMPLKVAAVAAGQAHVAILTCDGALWMMGLRGRGIVFDDSDDGSSGSSSGEEGSGGGGAPPLLTQVTPLRIMPGPLTGLRVRALRASLHHAYAITDNGEVYRWGWRGIVEKWRPEKLLFDDSAVERTAKEHGPWKGHVNELYFGYAHAVVILK